MPRPASRSPALNFDPALLLAAQGIKLVSASRIVAELGIGWGQGAVRELCDLLLCASGQYAALLAKAAGGNQAAHGSRP